MLFFEKWFGRGKPAAVPELADRAQIEVTRGLIPEKLDRIMRAANSGDTRDQSRLCRELLEHNADIAQAVRTRIDAVVGTPWTLTPGDDSPQAKVAAELLKKQLEAIDGEADNFEEMLEDLMGALLPGFAVSEILWLPGGGIAGFNSIEQHHFSLTESFFPRLVTSDQPRGIAIPRNRILYHRFRMHGKDPARGGLIRPLAWLHCFGNLNEKNLLAFAERYGMPFLAAKVDENAFNKERNTIKRLIRNFGSAGGGLFTRNVELQLLQAASGDGNIYFRLKEALANSINQLVLGQVASSGDSSGLSGGDAQSKVRQDILEGDCRRLARTINAQLCVPWAHYNFGGGIAAPRFSLECAAPEDLEKLSRVIQGLSAAGFVPEAAELTKRFGMKLTYSPPAQPVPGGSFGFSDCSVPASEGELADALEKLFGPAADAAGRITGILDDGALSDEECRAKLRGVELKGGDVSAMETLMNRDMERHYEGDIQS